MYGIGELILFGIVGCNFDTASLSNKFAPGILTLPVSAIHLLLDFDTASLSNTFAAGF